MQRETVERAGVDPATVGQVIAGCVSQTGEQTFDIGRTAWLGAGLPINVAGTTIDAQCGSSQQATNFAAALVAAGVVDSALGCGVESMSRIPLGIAVKNGPGRPLTPSFFERYEYATQFEAAERIADKWGITRADTDELGLHSQHAPRARGPRALRARGSPDRRAGSRQRRQAHRQHAPRRARRRAP